MAQDPQAQHPYWEAAGAVSYHKQKFVSATVGQCIEHKVWAMALSIADRICVPRSGRVVDIGCGDGMFVNRILAKSFKTVRGVDFSRTAIQRATAEAPSNATFEVFDLSRSSVPALGHFDGAFMLGILHHVKALAAGIAKSMPCVAPRIVVIEPNGNHIMRKLLEFTPSYRAAGDDSFRRSQIPHIFEAAGYRTIANERLNIFPNFTPRILYDLLCPLEPLIEKSPILNGLCTANAYGFGL
jgi:SAM-dependent methyltransferase